MAQERRRILIRGTGTVGYEFIRRLCLFTASGHPYFDWEEIIFDKRSPFEKNVPKIKQLQELIKEGVRPRLCTRKERVDEFKQIGLQPTYTLEEALERADVVFDATPSGGENKRLYEMYTGDGRVFIAEGSEFKKKKQFGDIFVSGVNERAILDHLRGGRQFFVVGSCNTHAIARNVLLIKKAFPSLPEEEIRIEATVLRRSDDPNKEQTTTSFSFSQFDEEYVEEGSYHAYNVLAAFRSVGDERIKLRVTVAKLADPFMHCLLWKVTLPTQVPDARERFMEAVIADPFCSRTGYRQANIVYWESKEVKRFDVAPWLLRDRCYSHTIVCLPTVGTHVSDGKTVLEYCTFTPQDSNVILSNLEMACMAKNPDAFSTEEFHNLVAPLLEPREI